MEVLPSHGSPIYGRLLRLKSQGEGTAVGLVQTDGTGTHRKVGSCGFIIALCWTAAYTHAIIPGRWSSIFERRVWERLPAHRFIGHEKTRMAHNTYIIYKGCNWRCRIAMSGTSSSSRDIILGMLQRLNDRVPFFYKVDTETFHDAELCGFHLSKLHKLMSQWWHTDVSPLHLWSEIIQWTAGVWRAVCSSVSTAVPLWLWLTWVNIFHGVRSPTDV